MAPLKGPGEARKYDGKLASSQAPASVTLQADDCIFPIYSGSGLRVGIVHARWNSKIIDSLLDGAKKSLAAAGVKDENIVIQTVPGSYELPFAVQR